MNSCPEVRHYFLPWSKIKKICRCNALQESAVLTWSLLLSLQMESMARTLHIMYFVSITTLLFGILGLFGAIKGKQWALIMVGTPVTVVSSLTPPALIRASVSVAVRSWNDHHQSLHDCVWDTGADFSATGTTKQTLCFVFLSAKIYIRELKMVQEAASGENLEFIE